MVRSAETTIKLDFSSTIKNTLKGGLVASLKVGQSVLSSSLANGIGAGQVNRAWKETSITITSGATLDIDLYGFVGRDIGSGLGRDGLGQLMSISQIVFLAIKQTAGPGQLEIMPTAPTNSVKWVPAGLATVANGGALRPGGTRVWYRDDADAFDVSNASNHLLRLGASGGAVTFDLLVAARNLEKQYWSGTQAGTPRVIHHDNEVKLADYSGNANHAPLNGPMAHIGIPTSVNIFVDCGATALVPATGVFTIASVFQYKNNNTGTIFSQYVNDTGSDGLRLYINTGGVPTLRIYDLVLSDVIVTAPALTLGRWYFITARRSASDVWSLGIDQAYNTTTLARTVTQHGCMIGMITTGATYNTPATSQLRQPMAFLGIWLSDLGDDTLNAFCPFAELWAVSTAYSVNDRRRGSDGLYYVCTVAGTSAGSSVDLAGGSDTGCSWATYEPGAIPASTHRFFTFSNNIDAQTSDSTLRKGTPTVYDLSSNQANGAFQNHLANPVNNTTLNTVVYTDRQSVFDILTKGGGFGSYLRGYVVPNLLGTSTPADDNPQNRPAGRLMEGQEVDLSAIGTVLADTTNGKYKLGDGTNDSNVIFANEDAQGNQEVIAISPPADATTKAAMEVIVAPQVEDVSTYWKFLSSEQSAPDVTAWNNAMVPIDGDGVSTAVIEYEHRHQMFAHVGPGVVVPVMQSDGRLMMQITDVHQGNSVDHSIMGAYSPALLANKSSLEIGKHYRIYFDVDVPSGASAWIDTVTFNICFQLWGTFDVGETNTNPPLAIFFDSDVVLSIKTLKIIQYADDEEPPGDIPAVGSRDVEVIDTSNQWSTPPESRSFQIDYTPDFTKAVLNNGSSTILRDGTQIFQHIGQNAFHTHVLHGTDDTDRGAIIQMGVYTPDSFTDPGVQLFFKRFEFARVTGP